MKTYLDGRLLTDAVEIEEIDTLLNACNIDDGLTLSLDQAKNVIDCACYYSDDCLLFVADVYKRKTDVQNEVFNFSHINDCKFCDYEQLEKRMFSDHCALNEYLRNQAKRMFVH